MNNFKTLTLLSCALWAPSLWAQDCPCDGGTSEYLYDCDGDGTNDSCEECIPCHNGLPASGGMACCQEDEYDPASKCCDSQHGVYDKPVISGEHNICVSTDWPANNTTTLTVSGGYAPYSWSSDNTSIAKIIGPSTGASVVVKTGGTVGTTSIRVNDKNNCERVFAVSTSFDSLSYISLLSCQTKFQHPTNPIDTNGCTGVPDSYDPVDPAYPSVDFTDDCNAHDRCYGTCGSNKTTCDNNLGSDMGVRCLNAYPEGSYERDICLSKAIAYAEGVLLAGGPFWLDAQVEFCVCCDGFSK